MSACPVKGVGYTYRDTDPAGLPGKGRRADASIRTLCCLLYTSIDFYEIRQRAIVSATHFTEKYFVFVARIDNYQKDHLTVIKAFKKLVLKYPEAKMYFIGDGTGRNYYENMVKDVYKRQI